MLLVARQQKVSRNHHSFLPSFQQLNLTANYTRRCWIWRSLPLTFSQLLPAIESILQFPAQSGYIYIPFVWYVKGCCCCCCLVARVSSTQFTYSRQRRATLITAIIDLGSGGCFKMYLNMRLILVIHDSATLFPPPIGRSEQSRSPHHPTTTTI